ncbi:MAG: OmpH family outer membrane protein [Abitibacteriaceae bacterium]|nr:OmpH family outer membrane protein [Abditibacteriaceae bacterium]
MHLQKYQQNGLKVKLISALALCWIGWVGHAAQAQAIGVVDEEKLGQNYTKYKTAVSDIEKRAQGLDGQLSARLLLNTDESKQFDTLIAKPTRTAAEEADLKKLVDAGTARQTEYNGLLGTVTKSDKDKARMKELETQAESNKASLQHLQDDLYAKMKQEQESTDKQYTDRANTVIKQVAEDKKLALVVRKVAVVWSADSTDITDEVLKRLNNG